MDQGVGAKDARDPAEIDGRDGRRPDAGPPRSSGLTLLGLLAGVVLVAVVIGQLTTPEPAPRRPPTAVAPTFEIEPAPEPSLPIGVDSLKRCPVKLGGLSLRDPLKVRGSALERWDCDAIKGPWSVVIRASPHGDFGVLSAVVTFPVSGEGRGTPQPVPQGATWSAESRTLSWPVSGSWAEIVGDVGLSDLVDLARRITISGGKPRLPAMNGYVVAASMNYRPPVVHEMRYDAKDLGVENRIGNGLVSTGVLSGAWFESLALAEDATPTGMVRGKQAIYSTVLGGNGTLAWESAPGEVTYIGFSGTAGGSDAVETLRWLANQGKVLTPAQWQTKDRVPAAGLSG